MIDIKGKRLLHFFLDEKVVNDAITGFETVFPNENIFIVLCQGGKHKMVDDHPNTFFLSGNSPELKSIINSCRLFKEVICHCMWYELARVINKMDHPNITWIVWGADLFETLLYPKGYKLYFEEDKLIKVRAQKIPVPLYRLLIGIRDKIHYNESKKAIDKVKSVMCNSTTFDIFTHYYPEYSNLRRKELFYYPIEKMLDDDIKDSYVSGRNVWINNSACYNGNHVEIFNRVKDFKTVDSFVVPLSYGMPKYAKYVDEEGNHLLGEKFVPIKTFVEKKEYYRRFLGSNSFVFGHMRSCAEGNIIVALYLGAKVFLFKTNPLYRFYLNMGIVVFSIEDELNEKEVCTPLSSKERENNRSIIVGKYSYDRLINVVESNFS